MQKNDEEQPPRSSIRVGCCGFGTKQQATYFRSLDLLELQESLLAPPRASRLRRLRSQAPPGFVFSVKAWHLITHDPDARAFRRAPAEARPPGRRDAFGLLRDTPEVKAALEVTLTAAAALGASAIVFETPPAFSPTAEHRKRLSSFFAQVPRQGRLLVWEPRGLWSPGDILAASADLDLVPCLDPLLGTLPPLEHAYLKVHGYGQTGRLPPATLEEILEATLANGRSYCLLNTANRFADAVRLAALLGEEGEEGSASDFDDTLE